MERIILKINFLTGSLAYREHKTGVHVFHDMLIKKTLEHQQFAVNISFYDKCKDVKKYVPPFISNNSTQLYSSKIVRLLTYIMPIEFFYGTSDVYICDGLIPITIKKGKRIAIIFDLMVKVFPEYYGTVKKIYLNYYFHRCKKADVIITISETTKADIIKYLNIPEKRIIVVPCGYSDGDVTGSLSNEISSLLNNKYLFYVGDMRKNKNLLTAIKGFKEAYQQDPNLKFYIAGKKSGEYESLIKYVKEQGITDAVKFIGYVSDFEKVALYKNCFALLFVSKYEGFGIPILEAAFYGAPVITSNCSSTGEIASGYSITVNPNNPDEIKKAILSLNDEDLSRSVVEKQSELLKKYTWENMYSCFEKVIKKLNA